MIRHGNIEIDCVQMVIRNGEHKHKLASNARRVQFPILCHLILSGGVTLDQLFELLWGHREDGGPMTGIELLRVRFCQYKTIFCALNMKLVRERRSGHRHSHYSLVPDDVV